MNNVVCHLLFHLDSRISTGIPKILIGNYDKLFSYRNSYKNLGLDLRNLIEMFHIKFI